jgi:hypothetical protein
MPFTADTFTHLFDWEKDPQRQEKIVNTRLEAEFDGVDTGLSVTATRITSVEAAVAAGVGDNAITNAKLADMPAYTIKGRNAGTVGDPSDIDIAALTEKVTLANADLFLIQDSAAGNAFKKVQKVNVATAAPAASDTVAGLIEIAVQAELEAAASTTLAVTPGRQQFHPSAIKAWVEVNMTSGSVASISSSYNITSITDNGVGDVTVTIATDFSSTVYGFSGLAGLNADGAIRIITGPAMTAKTAGAFRFQVYDPLINPVDDWRAGLLFAGDQ